MKNIIQFPDPEMADDEGLVAIGGDLKPETIISAYMQGIFPWFNEGSNILWWSPNPRMILTFENFHLSKSMIQLLKKNIFTVRIDTNFEKVIDACANANRKNQTGTWITREMREAYIILFKLGIAHSVETFFDGELVGGLYGISIGTIFFGESMFYKKANASKFALYKLVQLLKSAGYSFIDVQQSTTHLESLGAHNIPRHEFLALLYNNVRSQPSKNVWK